MCFFRKSTQPTRTRAEIIPSRVGAGKSVAHTLPWALLTLWVLGASASCGYGADEAVSVESVGGKTHTGALAELTADQLVIRGAMGGTIPMADVVRIDWPGRRVASLCGQNLVLLANGDRIVADPVQTANDILRAKWRDFAGLPLLSIPLEMVQGIAWKLSQDRTLRSRVITRLLDHAAKTDLLTLKNGNSVSGQFVEFDTDALQIDTAAGPLKINHDSLSSLAFNPELIAFPELEGMRVITTLIDGSRFTATQFQFKPDSGIEFTTAFGGQVTVAVDRVASMQVGGGRAIYLSDLKPHRYTFTPYLSLHWPLRADRDVTGESLRLGGREFAKGLGTHSQAEIAYDLDGQYGHFQALVGIDDDAGPQAHAIAEVFIDGELVWTSEPLMSGHPPQRIASLDVTGAHTLTLRVQFGDWGDVQDHVNWCDALLVRRP